MTIIGLDEAGRGPLAGPVVAAAVLVERGRKINLLRDSKKLSASERERFFHLIDKNFQWSYSAVSSSVIDKINILEATKLAMRRCVSKLPSADQVIIDGNFLINSGFPEKSVIKGDEIIYACRLASVMAKVVRDRMMEKYELQYPGYNLKQHKGYPTPEHYRLLEINGPSKIHRRSFLPRI